MGSFKKNLKDHASRMCIKNVCPYPKNGKLEEKNSRRINAKMKIDKNLKKD